MKFGKELKKQKVPEWTEAYVDYNGLKRILQEIRSFEQCQKPSTPSGNSLNIPVEDFTDLNMHDQDPSTQVDIENQVIAVNSEQQQNSRKIYKTKLLSIPKGGENEIKFFKKLDDELNKTNNFFKDKVEEVMREAALLNKQMDAFIALRIKVMNPYFDGSGSLKCLNTDISNLAPSKITFPGRADTSGSKQIYRGSAAEINCSSLLKPGSPGSSCQAQESSCQTKFETHSMESCTSAATTEENPMEFRTSHLEILDRVTISNTYDSPISTIKGVLKDSKDKGLSCNREELKQVEERLKLVFVEFYQKLYLLKCYSFMNLSAFSKILKKYEKITSRRVARSYMRIVDNSYIGSSDEVICLMEKVESVFVKHFLNSNRREGMKLLRPKKKIEKHSITFFSGFFSGFSISLLVAVVLLICDRKLIQKKSRTSYLNVIFPLYSFFVYIVFHMLLYGANIYFWNRYRINYPFIFGFKQGTELGYRDVFLLSNGLAVIALGTFLVVLAVMFCPFDVIYRSSRFFLIKCVFHCICAPFYKVTLPDFFLADQLTSQIQALRTLEYYVCFYGRGKLSQRSKCSSHDIYNVFNFIVAVIPYWFRFMQCVRRFFEGEDYTAHGFNGLRYFLTIVAVVIRTAFELRKTLTWEVLAVVSSAVATLGNTYWDIVVDWGLLQRNSKNLFLREKLLVSHKSVYFAAMVLDILLRFAWLQVVLPVDLQSLHGMALSTVFACLEILRRGIWNFFRLENEHLNNVGKYRAFKSVPLPFNYYDDEDEDYDDNDKDD
ncbi:phosphate transporter PHO1 homolog 10 isoform X2 [Henckelia pumila]|uniref:phosphate transporter PHO1 homolog 10 isoform X2 n=1 Tax=Henckelia pumila TaxID=405737 RepID=UPI003C6DDF47